MIRMNHRSAVVLFGCLLAGGSAAFAADEPASKEPAPPDAFTKRLQDYFQKTAAEYTLYRDDEQEVPLTFVPQAVFHWKQDTDWRGDVFIWTHEGRPEVVGGVFVSSPSGGRRTIYQEFRSLSLQPLGAIRTRAGNWKPELGIVLTPVPEAKTPAASEALRGAQLRGMAKQFTVTMKDNEGQPWELRLLPQPLYRYASPAQKVLDGALFTYVWTRGTDPECLLLIEARDEGKGPAWVYTPVRNTVRPLEMKHAGNSIWVSQRGLPDPTRPEPGTSFAIGTLPIAEDPQ
jgi:hypothetical protein